MKNTILAKEEVNIGRQGEFDYLKGFFMLFIFLIHAFQATLSPEDFAARVIYMFATMSGAAIFIFVMGMGTAYSKNAAPKALCQSGIRMVAYQYLNNLAYVAALFLPYPLVRGRLSDAGMQNFRYLVEIFIQYTNIFFITGIIYLVLEFLKKLDMKTAGYAILGVAGSIAASFLYGKQVSVPVVGYVVRLLIGEADFVSFTPLYFLSYALFGVAFGKMLRRVTDKTAFYRRLAVPSVLIILVWWAVMFGKYGADLSEMYAVLTASYTQPDLLHVAASIAHILAFAILIFFIGRRGHAGGGQKEPQNPVARQLLYYNRHISKYYALHVPVYLAAFGIHGYESFQSYQCWLLALLSMVVTELMVRGCNRLKKTS